jgi:rfaE bifunctional protein nucleotidyltransferase chain/domain/rfaE bifunctional protein kinase chain/domain
VSAAGRLVVVGDTLLDRDVDGTADRVCPDAPALVLTEQAMVDRPGGAGLAAMLAARDDLEVVLVTGLATDAAGARLNRLLTSAGVAVDPLPLPGATPEKVRLRAGDRLLLRLDRGGAGQVPGPPTERALAALRSASAVLVSDYGRGLTRQPALRAALAQANAPVVWDPHPRGAPAVPGARLVTPNEPELATLTGRTAGMNGERGRRLATVARDAEQLRRRWRAGAVAVTLAADGALLCHAGPTPLVVPVPTPAAGDSCGAGDSFAASAALALARGALVSEAVEAAVAAASAYVRAGGARGAVAGEPYPAGGAGTVAGGPHPGGGADVTQAAGMAVVSGVAGVGTGAAADLVARVRGRGGTVVATGGCFDLLHAGHVATLEAARRLGDCLVVCVNSDASVSRLKGPERPLMPQQDRARLLAALGCVDAVVVFDEATPEAVLSRLRPDIWVKGGDYSGGTASGPDLPEAESVRCWGGQAVVVPFLDGRSTTDMIAAARSGSRWDGVGDRSAPPDRNSRARRGA